MSEELSGPDLWDAEAVTFDDEVDHGLTTPEAVAAWRALLLGHLPAAPARVADLGCGTATLACLLAAEGYAVDGVDFSPAMVERAQTKATGLDRVTVRLGDAADPPLEDGLYDVVLSRHVLWAMPDPLAALRRWERLLVPGGSLLLVEGSWSTGAGLTCERTTDLLRSVGRTPVSLALDDPAYWGRPITDERYLVAG